MANRHKAFKKGGKVAYNAEKSNVMAEAKKHAKGGKAMKAECRATGGAAAPRMDKRARGGGIGKTGSGKDMTKSPFSAAHFKTKGDA